MDSSVCVPVAMPGNRLRILIYIIIAVTSVLTAVTVFLLVERVSSFNHFTDKLTEPSIKHLASFTLRLGPTALKIVEYRLMTSYIVRIT